MPGDAIERTAVKASVRLAPGESARMGIAGAAEIGEEREASVMGDLGTHYLEEAGRQFRGHKRLAEGAIAQVSDQEFFRALDPEANSIALIVKHISGNLRSRFRDFLTTDGEKPNRNRDQEFVLADEASRQESMRVWDESWEVLFQTLASLTAEDLERTVTVRGQPHSVLQALNRQVAHYAYHVGQVVFLAKHFRGEKWKSLSVPKGQSESYTADARKKAAERSTRQEAPS